LVEVLGPNVLFKSIYTVFCYIFCYWYY